MDQRTLYVRELENVALIERLERRLADLGFGQWIYSAVPTCQSPTCLPVNRITSYPSGFVDDYNHFGFASVDPSTPYWISSQKAATYRQVRNTVTLSAKQRRLMELNYSHAVNVGVVIPLRNVFGFKAVLALAYGGSRRDFGACLGEVQNELASTAATFNHSMLAHFRSVFSSLAPALTAQQRQVLNLLAHGLLTKEIAETLSVSVNAVDKHVANIKTRLSAKTSAEATALAVQWQLI